MAKKKINKVEREQCEMPYGYKVKIDQYCDHYESENEPYGSWSASYTNSVDDMIIKTDEYPDVASIHDVKPGERAFIVWAEWSSGDSFGHGDRNYTEVLGLFVRYEDAEVLQKALEEHARKYDRRGYEKDATSYYVKTPDGQIFQSCWAPWLGYFESLDSIHIDRVEVR